jgi:hypothetical protein
VDLGFHPSKYEFKKKFNQERQCKQNQEVIRYMARKSEDSSPQSETL